jgi:pimeloyl-ACP methyl ester carboxylesterase
MQWQEIKVSEGKYAGQFYTKYGSGHKILLLIHGYAESALIFTDMVKYLEANFTIIMPNLPGTSGTNILNGKASIAALADYCLHILEIEKVSEYFLCGHSLGGYISLHLLAQHYQKIIGLSLLNSHCYADDESKKAKRDQAIDLANSGKAAEVLSTLVHSIYPNNFKVKYPEKIAKHVALAHSINAKGVQYYNQAMMDRQDYSQTLSNAKMPVNIIIADEDSTCAQVLLRDMLIFPSLVFVSILRNCGHQGMIQYPQEIAKNLVALAELAVICSRNRNKL